MQRFAFVDGWEARPKANRFAERVGAAADWAPVTLPHDTVIGTERSPEMTAATGFFRGGVWVYRRLLDRPEEHEGQAIEVEFEGIHRDALVYVNGEFAAHQGFGYSGFTVPIDHLLHAGAGNEIKVEARSGNDSRWYTGGGIYRPVWLHRAGRVHIAPDGVHVRTPEVDELGAVVTVAVEVRNQSVRTSRAVLRAELLDADGTVVAGDEAPVTLFPGRSMTIRRRLVVERPRRWGVDDPNLYGCRTTLVVDGEAVDEVTTSVGIRSLALDARRGLRINGEPVLLRGACIHHDNGPLGAATIDRAEERRVELLKAAGFNAVRSAHNPVSRALLDACDRHGVLVMDESFDMWQQPKNEDDHALRLTEGWETDVETMVRKDRNHPSVILYSIGNEIPDGSTMAGLHLARAMAEKVRALDDTRYVTQGVSGLMVAGSGIFDEIGKLLEERAVDEESGINTTMSAVHEVMPLLMQSPTVDQSTAEAFSHLDVAGYNYMETRFAADGELHPNRVIVATESHPSVMDACWAAVVDNPHVVGDFTWAGWDYLGEAGVGRVVHSHEALDTDDAGFLGPYPWLTAYCADLDITGHRRPQSFYREILFGLRTDPYIAVSRPEHRDVPMRHSGPWSWTDVVSSWSWLGHEGTPLTVEVYADADEVELLLNGRSVGRAPADAKHRFRAQFEVAFEPGELEAVAWRGGEAIGRTSLRSASEVVQLDVAVDRTEISADPSDLAYVELTLVDADGTLQNTADRTIAVEVVGPGVLQGFASGDPRGGLPFTGAEQRTFDGRALAVIRPTAPGTITVTATAEGCEPQRATITAR